MKKMKFNEYITKFQFKELFLDLGWNQDRNAIPTFKINDVICQPIVTAIKNGFRIIECKVAQIPSYALRIQISNKIKALFHEHLLIFHDDLKQKQVWLYCYKQNNQNKKSEICWNTHQDVERLYQRASGLIFDLDEEDSITIIDVIERVRANFSNNADKVTKKFYTDFKKQHTALIGFIQGIQTQGDKEWYASIMLNRLMFCYFMQRRRFLNKDRDYLKNKLIESKEKLGKGKFYSFYRSFLLVLFRKGFGTAEHTSEIKEMIGEIPYLNGGIFDLHELEIKYPDIEISDEAFEKIFILFDGYDWHLDNRDCATGKEINPDVLGYIFEKYINDRSSMGAYYTQEDITGYIARSTILPWLFNSVKEKYSKAFDENGSIWNFLKESNDAYIFECVKHGIEKPLPDHINIGIDTTKPDLIKRRNLWNEPAPAEFALPTEIWREVIDRRTRCEKLIQLITNGDITNITDFITHNLDIVTFTTDILDTVEDPKFIMHFYTHLEKITILDPTCGSGAFLFAALNILEPLYYCCLSRMQDYLDHNYKGILDKSVKHFFEQKISNLVNSSHQNKPYFIYKSIILNNIYGVDIMKEAVETAKLRLFLKLVSTVDPDYNKDNIGIDPLPDIDFNIKAGNALVGFANEDKLNMMFQENTHILDKKEETFEAMLQMSLAIKRFKLLQLGEGDYHSNDLQNAKKDLLNRQKKLKNTLDELLRECDYPAVNDNDWNTNYFPFHWISEFYNIITINGGFDVIIGNPPYVEYSEVRDKYYIKGYSTLDCGNLYAFTIESVLKLINKNSFVGVIVPVSIGSTPRMEKLRKEIMKLNHSVFYSSFADRPSGLFFGVHQMVSICIIGNNGSNDINTAGFKHWYNTERENIFETLSFTTDKETTHENMWGKYNNALAINIYQKVMHDKEQLYRYFRRSGNLVTISGATGGYWLRAFSFEQPSKAYKKKFTSNIFEQQSICAFLNSTLFYFIWRLFSDCRNFTDEITKNINLDLKSSLNNLIKKSELYQEKLLSTKEVRIGKMTYDQFRPSKVKYLIDEIDTILASHYGFTEEELDYIINYDIKYRMGLGAESCEEGCNESD